MAKQLQSVLTALLFLLIILTLSLSLFHPPVALTQDLGRHLKLGEIIVNQHRVPRTNLFSYTHPDYPFINHHWLSEVIFYFFEHLWGITSLVYLKIVLLTSAFLLSLLTAARRSRLLFPLMASPLFLPVYLERTHIRPEIFSVFLFALLLFILTRRSPANPLPFSFYFLPLIFLVWVNLHIYFAAGLIVLSLFTLNQILHRQAGVKSLLLILLASAALLFINPNGLSGVLLPLTIFKSYGYSIIENQSPLLLLKVLPSQPTVYFLASVPLTLLAAALALKKHRLFVSLTLAFLLALSLKQIRSFPVYALTAVSLISPSLRRLCRHRRLTISLLVILCFWQSAVIFRRLFPLSPQAKINHLPLSLATPANLHAPFQFVKTHQLPGPIFNNFDIGGLAVYHLYPDYQVFVDNRPEAYPAEFFRDIYQPLQADPAAFTAAALRYRFQTIIFAHTDITPWAVSFLHDLVRNPAWTPVYLDSRVIIFVRRETNADLVASSAITPANVIEKIAPVLHTKNPAALINLTRFFTLVDWQEPVRAVNQHLRFAL